MNIKHRVFYLRVRRAQTHPKQSTLPVTRINTCTHRSSIFNKYEKYNSSNSTQTDKIATHEHLYSDQYYYINSVAKNPHIKRQQTKIRQLGVHISSWTYRSVGTWYSEIKPCLPLKPFVESFKCNFKTYLFPKTIDLQRHDFRSVLLSLSISSQFFCLFYVV